MTTSNITFTPSEVSSYYSARVPALKQSRAAEWRGPCQIHQGTRDSFAVEAATGLWCCHSQCGRGGDIISLEQELTGTHFRAAKDEVFRLIGRDGANENRQVPRIVAEYSYTDEFGDLLYQVVRLEPKNFKQRYPDGSGGWVWKKYQNQVLYHLREVLENPIIFLVEGERDAETLRNYGFVATTNAGGAKAPWLPQFTEALRGREVILIPDRDRDGYERVKRIARALLGNVARLFYLELEDGKDVTEWFQRGHSEVELIAQLDGEEVSQ